MAILHFLRNLGFSKRSSEDQDIYDDLRAGIEMLHEDLHAIKRVPGLANKPRGKITTMCSIVDDLHENFVWTESAQEASGTDKAQVSRVLKSLHKQVYALLEDLSYFDDINLSDPRSVREVGRMIEDLEQTFMDGVRRMQRFWEQYCEDDRELVVRARETLSMIATRAQVYDCNIHGEQARMEVFLQGRNDPVKLRLLQYLVLPHPQQNIDFLPRNPVRVRLHRDPHFPIPHYNLEFMRNGDHHNVHVVSYKHAADARRYLHRYAA